MIPDEVAIEAMRQGARDFISKDNLLRLAPVVEREVLEAGNRAALRQAQASLDHLMRFDPLTGIANADFLMEHLDRLTSTQEPRPFLLLLLDINRFRKIIHGMGMVLSNRVLRAVARRLSALTGRNDFIARISADRFALAIADASTEAEVEQWFTRLRDAFSMGISVQGQELFLTCSVGGALFPSHTCQGNDLMQSAEAALDAAKRAGPSQCRVFNERLTLPQKGRLVLEAALYHALVNHEFVLHYQPQVELASGRITGVEALVRWQSPERGLVPPGEFIPLLEETGLIVPVGEWVLREACRQSVAWREAGYGPLRVAVNLSALQFQQPRLAESVKAIIEKSGADPRQIELEITENIAMNQEEEVLDTLRQLRDIGASLAIDDFGTGYSSLSYLQQFPIHRLKIDQSFVRGQAAGGDLSIARAIVAMGNSLGLEVIAEGVETAEQRARLVEFGCLEGQGFHFFRPLPASDLAPILGR
jgi:diguanylate cyclase (GGDEF)-like protein